MKFTSTILLFFICQIYFSQSFKWVKNITGLDDIEIKKIVHLQNDNFLLAGNYEGSINFDNQLISSIGNKDFFISKQDSSGNLIWLKSFGGFDDVEIEDILVNNDNKILICGTFEGNILLDSILLTNAFGKNAFLAKLDSNGNLDWAKNFESSNDVEANSIELDFSKNKLSFVAEYEGSVQFDTINLISFGNKSLLFSRFNLDGTCNWYKEISSQDEIKATCLKHDSIGNIYCYGTFDGNILFQNTVLSNSSDKDIFLIKTDTLGSLLWTKTVGGTNDVEASKFFIRDTNILIIGTFSGTANFQNSSISSSGDDDGFLARISLENNESWVSTMNSTDEVSPKDICVDDSNNIYIIGSIESDTYFDNIFIQNNSNEDLFICKYDIFGSAKWVKSIGGTDDIEGKTMFLNNKNELIFSGNFEGSAFFDTITISALDEKDGFFGKLTFDSFNVSNVSLEKVKLVVFPNPASDIINIHYNSISRKLINQLYDLNGKLLISSNSPVISLKNLKKGNYLLRILDGAESLNEVIITKH